MQNSAELREAVDEFAQALDDLSSASSAVAARVYELTSEVPVEALEVTDDALATSLAALDGPAEAVAGLSTRLWRVLISSVEEDWAASMNDAMDRCLALIGAQYLAVGLVGRLWIGLEPDADTQAAIAQVAGSLLGYGSSGAQSVVGVANACKQIVDGGGSKLRELLLVALPSVTVLDHLWHELSNGQFGIELQDAKRRLGPFRRWVAEKVRDLLRPAQEHVRQMLDRSDAGGGMAAWVGTQVKDNWDRLEQAAEDQVEERLERGLVANVLGRLLREPIVILDASSALDAEADETERHRREGAIDALVLDQRRRLEWMSWCASGLRWARRPVAALGHPELVPIAVVGLGLVTVWLTHDALDSPWASWLPDRIRGVQALAHGAR